MSCWRNLNSLTKQKYLHPKQIQVFRKNINQVQKTNGILIFLGRSGVTSGDYSLLVFSICS